MGTADGSPQPTMTLTLTFWALQAGLMPITALTSRLQPELSPPPQDPWTPLLWTFCSRFYARLNFASSRQLSVIYLALFAPLGAHADLHLEPLLSLGSLSCGAVDRLSAGTEGCLGSGLPSSGRLTSFCRAPRSSGEKAVNLPEAYAQDWPSVHPIKPSWWTQVTRPVNRVTCWGDRAPHPNRAAVKSHWERSWHAGMGIFPGPFCISHKQSTWVSLKSSLGERIAVWCEAS